MPNKSGKTSKSELRAEIALQLAQIIELRGEVLELREWSCNGWAAASAEMNLKLEAHKTNSRLEAELRKLRGPKPVEPMTTVGFTELLGALRETTDVPLPPSQWVQEALFENTEDGSNVAKVQKFPGPWCRPCNLTHTESCLVCSNCHGPLILPASETL